MKKLFCLLALALALVSYANDGVYYTSGNQLVPLKETDISVKKEVLTISLQDNGTAKVDVYYEFFNPGNSEKSLLMGFEAMPSYNDDYEFYPSGRHPHILNFTVEFNGVALDHKNAVSTLGEFKPLKADKWEMDNESGTSIVEKGTNNRIDDYAYVYYFDAKFKPGLNKVHHTYSYTMSSTVGTQYEVDYKLSPAGRWAGGKIEDFTLIIRADNTAKHFSIAQEILQGMNPEIIEGTGKNRIHTHYETKYLEIALRNGAVKFHTANFKPDADHELYISSSDMYTSFNENARFGEYYDRASVLQLYLWDETEHTQKLSKDFVSRIARNLPYANRGRIFKDPKVKKYFESLWWYMPDPSYTDNTSDFTKQDWEYVKY